VLKFDGSNYRIVAATPQTINSYGGLMPSGTPADSGPCQTGQLEFDSNYIYLCTGTNTFRRAALSAY
jgi:hypothetical protein